MSSTETPVGTVRLRHLDNLKLALVGYVIAGHALLGYTNLGGWAYGEINEVRLAAPSELILIVTWGPMSLVVIGLFFFITGLLTEGTLERHGRRRYISDRVWRLGLPWLVSALLVWPAAVWVAYRGAGRDVSFWWVLSHRHPLLDSGSLWFALVLLAFSVAFAFGRAALRRVRPAAQDRSRRPLTGAHLVGVVAAMAAAAFVVRLWFPIHSAQIGDLHLWWWPQCVGMFALGIVAARRGWTQHVPDRLRRGSGVVILVTLVAMPVLAYATGLRSLSQGAAAYYGGWHWQALATAGVESTLLVAGSVWLVGSAERHFVGAGPHTTAWSNAAFGAFVVQGPVLMLLATAARAFGVPAEIKAPIVAATAVVASFWVSRLLSALFKARPARSRHSRPAAAVRP